MLPPPHSLSELITRHDPKLVMETICSSRTRAWELLVEAAEGSGRQVGSELRGVAGWLDEDWRPDTLNRTGPAPSALQLECRRVLESCREELAAWQDGRDDDAKQIRVQQLDLVAAGSELRAAAQADAHGVGGLVLDYLRLETGR